MTWAGSSGTGDGESRPRPPRWDLSNQLQDAEAAYALVVKRAGEWGVDTTRIGMIGFSAGAGPTEWQNYNTWYSGAVIGNAADGKPEDLDKHSLTHLAENLQSPLLLLHGMEDTNVLFQDTVKQYRKLLQYGKGHLVELALDPTGGHGMGGDMSNRDMHMIYYEFIKRRWRL